MSTATQVAEATNHVRNNAQHDIHADNAFAFAADVLVAEGSAIRDRRVVRSELASRACRYPTGARQHRGAACQWHA